MSEETRSFTAADGAGNTLRIFRAQDAGAPVIVHLPAMGVRASYYSGFAQSLSEAGVHTVTADLRGNGESSLRPSRTVDFGYNEMLSLDMPALLAEVRAAFPGNRLLLSGHSLGGQLSALYLSARPDDADGLILIAACNVHYKGFEQFKGLPVLFLATVMRSMGFVLGHVPSGRIGFGGNEARTAVIDWSNNCYTGRYVVRNADHDFERSLGQMTKPVLSVAFAGDRLAPPKAVDNLLVKMPAADTSRRVFARNHPGLENIGHFDWAKRPEMLIAEIGTWIGGLAKS